MKSPLYLSSGAFTGRINGRDPGLLPLADRAFSVDGFELMVYEELYDMLPGVLLRYNDAGVRIPVIHTDKAIGDYISLPEGEDEARRLFEKNLDMAALVGAKRLVVHGWGMPPSDRYLENVYRRVGLLKEAAAARGMTLLCENCVCANHSPLYHVRNLLSLYPDLEFCIDTRCAEFHAELRYTMEDAVIWRNVTHLHINDYRGGYKEWAARRPILQPSKGQIDWAYFFSALQRRGFRGSVTLEAPAMLEKGLDVSVLSEGLNFIRRGFESVQL